MVFEEKILGARGARTLGYIAHEKSRILDNFKKGLVNVEIGIKMVRVYVEVTHVITEVLIKFFEKRNLGAPGRQILVL